VKSKTARHARRSGDTSMEPRTYQRTNMAKRRNSPDDTTGKLQLLLLRLQLMHLLWTVLIDGGEIMQRVLIALSM
jgi:hypothetical protein